MKFSVSVWERISELFDAYTPAMNWRFGFDLHLIKDIKECNYKYIQAVISLQSIFVSYLPVGVYSHENCPAEKRNSTTEW